MKIKSNLLLCAGLILYTATLFLSHLTDLPDILYFIFMLSALSMELWGIILLARSPAMRNSKLRAWKLRLFGREPK